MLRVKADQLKEGMRVARDVKNIDGMLLVAAATELNARQVDILQSWGVTEVEIEGDANQASLCNPMARLSAEDLSRLTAELKARFWRPEEFSPVQTEIFALMLERQARRSMMM